MPEVYGATNAQLETRVTTLETWKPIISGVVTMAQTDIAALKARPVGTDYSAQITALMARMTKLESLTCPNQTVIDALVADHIPTP